MKFSNQIKIRYSPFESKEVMPLKELEHCTFKPIIREYKITDPKAVVDFDLSDLSSPYSSLKYTPSSSTQDLRKSNRVKASIFYQVKMNF